MRGRALNGIGLSGKRSFRNLSASLLDPHEMRRTIGGGMRQMTCFIVLQSWSGMMRGPGSMERNILSWISNGSLGNRLNCVTATPG